MASFCSTPSLAETPQQKDLHLHQLECESAAAAPTAIEECVACSDVAAVAVAV